MKFSEFVVVESIQPKLTSTNKEDVLRELVDGLVQAGQIAGVDMPAVCNTVLEREELGSTGIGRGVAVPHAKHTAVSRPVGTVGVSQRGVDFNSLDGAPVHLLFALVSPPDRSADHLSVLEYVSRQLRHDLFCRLVRQSKTADEIWQILQEADETNGQALPEFAMIDLARQEIAASAKLIVKVGTRVVTTTDGKLDHQRIETLAEEISELIAQDRHVVLVSSGAVGAGMGRLGLDRRPNDLAKLQAVAAVGQAYLIEAYDRTFRQHGHHAAQVLLTADDLDNRTRYLNVRNTILSLLEYGAVPVVNENDTVAVDELATTFGDNDRLAAMVTNLIRAPLMVILSDVDGLYDGDPAHEDSQVLPVVTRLDETVLAYVKDRGSGVSKGGMASKLEAARIATMAGENVVIASGHRPGVLRQIMAGENVGTLILARGKSISPWKRWIGFSARRSGRLRIDAGAERAICEQGRSLLPAGITDVTGTFEKGDVVALCDGQGGEIARGLTNYPSTEIAKIKGLRSQQIAQVLGYHPYDEVVHRDNLAVTKDL